MVEDKYELLIDAIRSGDAEQFQTLLAYRDIDLERNCGEGKTPLMHAVEHSNGPAVRHLLNANVGANVNAASKKHKTTALHLAAQRGDHDLVICLLQFDAKVDARDRSGQTPLVKAVIAGHKTVTRALSDRHADTLTQDVSGWSILHHAARQPDVSIMELVLDIEPRLRDAVCSARKTALHYCVEFELLEHVEFLLEHRSKLDIDALDNRDRTPLYHAATGPWTERRASIVSVLLTHGATLYKSNPPPRWREYESLSSLLEPSVRSTRSRRDSVSTQGSSSTSSSTTSTAVTRLSTLFASRIKGR